MPLALLALASPAAAQTTRPLTVHISAFSSSHFGGDFHEMQRGTGWEAQLRYVTGRLSVGLGFQRASHDVVVSCDTDDCRSWSPAPPDIPVSLSGAFIEPRYALDEVGPLTPFISVRLSVLRKNGTSSVLDAFGDRHEVSMSASTGALGSVGGGVLLSVHDRMTLELGATMGRGDFGDQRLLVDGREEFFEVRNVESRGTQRDWTTRLRAGLVIAVGT